MSDPRLPAPAATTPSEPTPITTKTSVREVLTRHPDAEEIFDRHGLGGCGGPRGPIEPIGFFATVHRVDADALVRELNAFVSNAFLSEDARDSGEAESRRASLTAASSFRRHARPLYPPFLKSSVAIAALGGFALGAWALLSASLATAFPFASWTASIQTHAALQIWGFVALFVMGVAYHAVPRFQGADLSGRWRWMAGASYWLVLAGALGRLAQLALPGDGLTQAGIHALLLASATALLAGAFLFLLVLAHLLQPRLTAPPATQLLFAGGVWLTIAGTLTLAQSAWLAMTGEATVPRNLADAFATAGLLGFAVNMVLGVSARVLPAFLGLSESRPGMLRGSLWTVNSAVALLLVVQLSTQAGTASAWPPMIAAAMLLAGVIAFIAGLRLFEPGTFHYAAGAIAKGARSFGGRVRIVYGWLLVAAAIGAYLTVEAAVQGTPLTMTDVSAARHALALGFITSMIVVVAGRILPVFHGAALFSAKLHHAAFWLIFSSATLRVVGELGWGYGAKAEVLLSTSALFGLVGIIAFAWNVWMTLAERDPSELASRSGSLEAATEDEREAGSRRFVQAKADSGSWPERGSRRRRPATTAGNTPHTGVPPDETTAAPRRRPATMAENAGQPLDEDGPFRQAVPITAGTNVLEILKRYPDTLDVFVTFGFTPLKNPAMREKLAATVTLGQAAQLRGVELGSLLASLHKVVRQSADTSDRDTFPARPTNDSVANHVSPVRRGRR